VESGSLPGRLGWRRRRRWQRHGGSDGELWAHAAERWQGTCHHLEVREFARMAAPRATPCTVACAERKERLPARQGTPRRQRDPDMLAGTRASGSPR
jgi:hypothetical protein